MEQIISILKFVFKFVNTLRRRNTRDFKIKLFLTVFYNFNANELKSFACRLVFVASINAFINAPHLSLASHCVNNTVLTL